MILERADVLVARKPAEPNWLPARQHRPLEGSVAQLFSEAVATARRVPLVG